MNIRWWIAHFIMWRRGDKGCGGEGYVRGATGHTAPCTKFGCH